MKNTSPLVKAFLIVLLVGMLQLFAMALGNKSGDMLKVIRKELSRV